MRVLHPDPGGGVWLRDLTDAGVPVGAARHVAGVEHDDAVRWLWASTIDLYPGLLRAGLRLDRCHDLELTEALLLGVEGRWGEPRGLAAAVARLAGRPVSPDPPARAAVPPGEAQEALFDAAPAAPAGTVGDVVEVYAAQRERIEATPDPRRFRLLVAAESAGALLAVEMGAAGLPFRADVHDALLLDLLGEPAAMGGQPKRLTELQRAIENAFGGQRLNPTSAAEVVRAFGREGVPIPNTRAWSLRQVEHPAVPLLLEYKELYRIFTAHGRAWREQWVSDGRFRPEYVPAGVVSGRWASRGGGALQIPKVVRKAVLADPGRAFVVADASQLEPRVLAAMSGDRGLADAARSGDLYEALAAASFGGDRAKAKVALLGAMYGQTGGQAVPALAVLRRSYPKAWEYVEEAARTGEQGGLVRSWLGRTCPQSRSPHSATNQLLPVPFERLEGEDASYGRARGRFTRNFVVQATAAEWALVLLARLRTALAGSTAEIVFFQHDEVVVHCLAEDAAEVTAAVHRAGDDARQLLFGDTPVRFPLGVSTVDCYADAK